MNNVLTAVLVAGGLMLLNAPEAAAHTEVRYSYQTPHYQHYRHFDVQRSGHMPSWLRRNESFRRWYRHSSLKQHRRLAWGELFEIYRWERRYDRRYRHDDYYRKYERRDTRRKGRRHRH